MIASKILTTAFGPWVMVRIGVAEVFSGSVPPTGVVGFEVVPVGFATWRNSITLIPKGAVPHSTTEGRRSLPVHDSSRLKALTFNQGTAVTAANTIGQNASADFKKGPRAMRGDATNGGMKELYHVEIFFIGIWMR